jgi:hypothetical protein
MLKGRGVADKPCMGTPAKESAWKVLEALGWGAVAAGACYLGGLFGLILGGRMYPQRYEQFPIEIFFVPFAGGAGFLITMTARLARAEWRALRMLALVMTLGVISGYVMIRWSRANAREAHFAFTVAPNPVNATPCTPATCPPASPPWQWVVDGTMSIDSTDTMGVRVQWIEATGYVRLAPTGYNGSNYLSDAHIRIDPADVARRARTTYVRPGMTIQYPLRFFFRNARTGWKRGVSIIVAVEDDAGHPMTHGVEWAVR